VKILRLQSSNIQRVTAVDITPDPATRVIKIGGKNGNGKSSVLDTISIALGGQALCPAEPIHGGELEGMARLDLGELVVTRKFRRERLHTVDCGIHLAIEPKVCNCPPTFSPTTSSLVVANRDGAKYPTPQAILDRLKSDLTFDPLAFASATEKEQNAILRRIAGVDVSELDEQRRNDVALRTDLNRQVKAQEALFAAATFYKDAPAEEIGADEVNRTLAEAEELRKKADVAVSDFLLVKGALKDLENERDSLAEHIVEAERKITESKRRLEAVHEKVNQQMPVVAELLHVKESAASLVPDVSAIQQKLKAIEETNKQVRANAARKAVAAKHATLAQAAIAKTAAIEAADLAKAKLLAEAEFPIPGLGLTEYGVAFNGLPFAQAGSANQLRTSVAIGMALNPALRVLRIDNGNMLDDDSLKLLEEMAEAQDYQLWLEWVTSDASQVAVFIEDGHVA